MKTKEVMKKREVMKLRFVELYELLFLLVFRYYILPCSLHGVVQIDGHQLEVLCAAVGVEDDLGLEVRSQCKMLSNGHEEKRFFF